MEADESPEEDGPLFAFVHPDDRLWRHPSEVPAVPGDAGASTATGVLARPRPGALASRPWAVVVLAGVVGALAASGVLAMTGDLAPRTTVFAPVTRVMTPNTLAAAAIGAVTAPGWAAIVDAVAPSVASVTAWAADGPQTGSAVVYGTDEDHDVTYLMTDADLVGDAGPIDVTFNGGTAVAGHVMRADPTSGVALLWVAGGGRPAPDLGSVDVLHDADGVMAVGGRSSGDSATVSGSVSSLDRLVVDPDSSIATCGMLAMSATVPVGDDGGAVIDDHGSVVGIATGLTSTDPGDAGMAFAIPIDVAVHVAGQILAEEHVTHPWLGIDSASDLDTATAASMGVAGGAEVLDVAAGSPAAAADLQPDDVITALDDHPVTSSGSLLSQVATSSPGQVATLTFRRGAATTTVRLRVDEQPSNLGG